MKNPIASLRILALGAALALLCSACVTLGRPFTFEGPDSILVGKTTQKELINTYGRPFRVGVDNGNEKWAYSFYRYSLLGDSSVQDLDIIFDKGGVVTGYTYESSVPGDTDNKLPASPAPDAAKGLGQ